MAQTFKCVIIDDDLHSIETLEEYVGKIGGLELIKTFTNPLDVLQNISELKAIDLVFMDVDMPGISGIELTKILKPNFKKNIFITAHAQYALDAFEVEADAFLLKPIAFNKFAVTVNKLISDLSNKKVGDSESMNEFYVKTTNERNGLVKVRENQIIAIESLQNYIRIYTDQGKIVTYLTLKEIKVLLKSSDRFIQVHRSYIVSKKYIEKLEGNILKLTANLSVPIGSAYKDTVFDYFHANTLITGRMIRPDK